MSDIQNKLAAMLSNQGLMTGQEWRQKLDDLQQRRAQGAFEIQHVVPGKLVGDEDSAFFLVRTEYPLDTRHGRLDLGEALSAGAQHIAFAARDAELDGFDPSTALFVDTETTGLMGGAGTVIFLIGIGRFVDDVFQLDQCFLRDFDDEEPMLAYLEEQLRSCTSVVSYNGKSFDLPLLRNRFVQNRLRFPLESTPHYDLLHAVRRFYKRRLADCSLPNIERHVLGLKRHGDVSSAEIPRLWLDYLRSRDARPLEPVFYHHKMDILSLVALTAWVARCLAEPDGGGFEHAEDRLSLVRLYAREKRWEEVADGANRLLEAELNRTVLREVLELKAFACKRLQRWEEMQEAWEGLVREFPRELLARHELAKHYEHRLRNLPEAARLCEAAVEFLETRANLGRVDAEDSPELGAFRTRLERIRKKLARRGYGDEFL